MRVASHRDRNLFFSLHDPTITITHKRPRPESGVNSANRICHYSSRRGILEHGHHNMNVSLEVFTNRQGNISEAAEDSHFHIFVQSGALNTRVVHLSAQL